MYESIFSRFERGALCLKGLKTIISFSYRKDRKDCMTVSFHDVKYIVLPLVLCRSKEGTEISIRELQGILLLLTLLPKIIVSINNNY